MIRKIISCGTESVAVAAAEAANRLGLAFDGKGSEAEKGTETAGGEEMGERFRRCVVKADGTVLITRGADEARIEHARRICRQAGRPLLHLDLQVSGGFQAARQLSEWIGELKVNILHVGGTGDAADPALTRLVRDLLEASFYLTVMADESASSSPSPVFLEDAELPNTVAEAVARLKRQLPLKDKTTIGNMAENELAALDGTLGEYIRNTFRLWSGNYALLDSCRWVARKRATGETDAAAVIIYELWKELKKTHALRIIK